MHLEWEVTEDDVSKVATLVHERAHDPFVMLRVARNLKDPRPEINRDTVWRTLVGCLLSTQQKSGPTRPVSRFLALSPFPLNYGACVGVSDLKTHVREVLTGFGGIRRAPTIADQLNANFQHLEQGLWNQLLEAARESESAWKPEVEREVSHFLARTFSGIGPKQSRNLLQWLGVSRFEVPLDSRMTRWLNSSIFQFRLSATLLSDSTYYDLVSDGIIVLCSRAGVYPCVFDAAVFSSYDNGSWTEENLASERLL